MEISYTRQPTVTTDKNGYTEDQQTQYITRTAKELVKKERKVQEETLSQDKNWIDSAKILYQMQEDAEGELPPDEELSTWALDYVGQIQYNLVSGANAALEFQDADDMQKIAMRYAMETYDMKDITAAGAMRFAKGLATDPTTYIGLGSFGVGFGAKAAASQGAKKAFMQFLSKPANLAAVEGAMYGAAESGVQQNIEVATGARDEVDLGEVAMTAGIGAVAGKTLGEGIEYLGKKFSKKEVEEVQQEGQVIAQDIQANIGFAPELLGGSVNGLNYDEETGEFTFDPIRFMEGFLGGHVAKKIATNPKLNAKAKKEAMEYAQRTYDKLKDKPWFNYLTGTHRVIDDAPSIPKEVQAKVEKAIDKTTRDANFKKWFEGSKVVDDNGEPLVVYHGTADEITEFDSSFGGETTGNNDYGVFYFTNESDVAEDYSRQAMIRRYEDRDLDELVDYYDVSEEKAQKLIDDLYNTVEEDIKTVPVYLDIKNPLVVTEFNGDRIDLEKAQRYINFAKNKAFDEEDIVDEVGYENLYKFNKEDAADYKADIEERAIENHGLDSAEELEDYMIEEATEEIMNEYGLLEAVEYDGVILKNVIDDIGDQSNMLQDVYIAFEPNQIKSINNKGAFSKDGNILKSAMIVPVGVGSVAATQQDEGL